MQEPSFQTNSVVAQFSEAHARLPDAAGWVLLHIDAEQTAVVVSAAAAPDAVLTLTIGSQKTAREYFKHTPPSPLELENAIAMVEDEVTQARKLIPAGASLCTSDESIREIALLSGVTAGETMRLSLEAMERTFDRLALVSLGRPASSEGLPASNSFAATLLILREFIHHLQFAEITILSNQTD
jgi:exopolyphosphatase/pppGpp-phosphohydrolase